MILKFTPGKPIVLWTKISGPQGARTVKLLLDTGAAITMIRVDRLKAIGAQYEPNNTILITSASDVQPMPVARVPSIEIGEHRCENLSVIAHDLPGLANLDGLLGLDFLANLHVSIRMRQGILLLETDFLDDSEHNPRRDP